MDDGCTQQRNFQWIKFSLHISLSLASELAFTVKQSREGVYNADSSICVCVCVCVLSGACGGASLEEQWVADVTHTDRFGVRWQGQFVTGAAVAVDVPTVATVVLSAWDWELLLALLAVCGFIIFQPRMTLINKQKNTCHTIIFKSPEDFFYVYVYQL